MSFFERLFVINLDHRQDKLDEFKRECPLMWKDRYRFSAVNGKDIKVDSEILGLFRKNTFGWHAGTMGCAMSHYKIWKQVSLHEYKRVVVLEDDAFFTVSREQFTSVLECIPDDCDFCYLGGETHDINHVKINTHAAIPLSGSYRTTGYVLSSKGAQKLVKLFASELNDVPVDVFMQRAPVSKYCIIPSCVMSPMDYKSDIQGNFTLPKMPNMNDMCRDARTHNLTQIHVIPSQGLPQNIYWGFINKQDRASFDILICKSAPKQEIMSGTTSVGSIMHMKSGYILTQSGINRVLSGPETQLRIIIVSYIQKASDVNLSGVASCAPHGGLGNQMFQLANTLAYAARNSHKPTIYMLRHNGLRSWYWDTMFRGLGEFTQPIAPTSSRVYKEPDFSYHSIPDHDNIHMDGYFQSEKYFKDQWLQIRQKLVPNRYIVQANKELARYVAGKEKDIVSVHFRIGDYADTSEVHIVLDNKYYQNCLNDMNLDNSHFLIFYEPCDKNIVKERCEYIFGTYSLFHEGISWEMVNPEIPDYVQMLMIAQCPANIIANSTFSWWGAYLGSQKRVYAPRTWFNPSHTLSSQTSNLIPVGWKIID